MSASLPLAGLAGKDAVRQSGINTPGAWQACVHPLPERTVWRCVEGRARPLALLPRPEPLASDPSGSGVICGWAGREDVRSLGDF